ncbi:hypothetical protein [Dactylosporangium sp. CA-233914]|uniref:hypothetical protein n=1 Tax=Dactylosporangium sp. CA-233914 TaxID=3239934 RepID=UPI003D8A34DA
MTVSPVGGLDMWAVHKFVRGRLDDGAQGRLAQQVAYLLGQVEPPCTPVASGVRRVMEHLGGDTELLRWLDRFPGRPQLVTRTLNAVSLLDRVGDQRAVVLALRDLRDAEADAPGLVGHVAPDTDESLLAGISGEVKMLVKDDRLDEAGRLALAGLAMLLEVAPRLTGVPGLEGLNSTAGQAARALDEALPASS